jgi:membrane protein YqaA with SNARE-associated domain
MKALAVWERAMSPIRRLYDWMGKQAQSPYGVWVLALFFFVEAVFFFPADPLLILFCVQNRKKSFFYATVATAASVLGGVAGYYIGFLVWNTVGQKLVGLVSTQDTFTYLCQQYKLHQTWAVLVAGFTPIPYKLVTLTAGFCKLPLLPFIACSVIARGARFYLVAAAVYIWGVKIKKSIDQYFNLLVLLFVIMVGLTFFVFR